jgi:hypothetical protein
MAMDVSFLRRLDPSAAAQPPVRFEIRERSTGSFSHRATKIKTSRFARLTQRLHLEQHRYFGRLGQTTLSTMRNIYLNITRAQQNSLARRRAMTLTAEYCAER